MAKPTGSMYKNPRSLQSKPTGTPFNKNAPTPAAPPRARGLLEAAAQARMGARKQPQGAPPVPATERQDAPQPDIRREAISRMQPATPFTPDATMAPRTPQPTAFRPEPMTPVQVAAPRFDPMYARSGGQQPGMAPGKGDSGEEETNVYAEALKLKKKAELEKAGDPPYPGMVPMFDDQGNFTGWTTEDSSAGAPTYYSTSPGVDDPSHAQPAMAKADPYYSDSPGMDVVVADGVIDTSDEAAAAASDLMTKEFGIGDAAKKAQTAETKKEFLDAVNRSMREAALRRVSGAGAMLRGYGVTTGKYTTALNKRAIENAKLEMQERTERINQFLDQYGMLLDKETKTMMFDYQKNADKWADFTATVANHLEASGADIRSQATTKLTQMFERYVIGNQINPKTGQVWTTQDLMGEFFVQWKGHLWWTGYGPEPGFGEDEMSYYYQFDKGPHSKEAWGRLKSAGEKVAAEWGWDNYTAGIDTPPWDD